MRKSAAIVAALLFAAAPARAQYQFGGTQTYRAWLPSARLAPDLVLTGTSQTLALPAAPATPPVTRVCNVSGGNAYVAFGGQSVEAEIATSWPVYPGQCQNFNTTGQAFIAAITDGPFAVLSVVQGYGNP